LQLSYIKQHVQKFKIKALNVKSVNKYNQPTLDDRDILWQAQTWVFDKDNDR
jgi:hypothetical protein